MDRRAVTVTAKHLGASIACSDKTVTTYDFQTEDELFDFRDMIPYVSLWTPQPDNEFRLNVYFDQEKDY